MKTDYELRLERRRKSAQLHLTDEHLVAVGHVAVRSGMLDTMIEMTAEQIIRQYPKTLRDEALKFSTPKKLQLIKDDLSKEMPESEHAIAEYIGAVAAARQERNDIVHKMWRSTEAVDTKELVELRRGEPEKTIRRVTAKSMMALADRMTDFTFEMADWKIRSTLIRQRRFAASLRLRDPGIALPLAPRISVRDIEKRRPPGARSPSGSRSH